MKQVTATGSFEGGYLIDVRKLLTRIAWRCGCDIEFEVVGNWVTGQAGRYTVTGNEIEVSSFKVAVQQLFAHLA